MGKSVGGPADEGLTEQYAKEKQQKRGEYRVRTLEQLYHHNHLHDDETRIAIRVYFSDRQKVFVRWIVVARPSEARCRRQSKER